MGLGYYKRNHMDRLFWNDFMLATCYMGDDQGMLAKIKI
jgi:hypothetical protein